MAKKKAANLLPKLTETEQDLLSHMQQGYQLETDSLGGDPVLRRSKDDEGVRPLSANRNTIKALEQRGLISPGKGRDALTIMWRLKRTQNKTSAIPATGSGSVQLRPSATRLHLASSGTLLHVVCSMFP